MAVEPGGPETKAPLGEADGGLRQLGLGLGVELGGQQSADRVLRRLGAFGRERGSGPSPRGAPEQLRESLGARPLGARARALLDRASSITEG